MIMNKPNQRPALPGSLPVGEGNLSVKCNGNTRTKQPSQRRLGVLSCGQWDNYRTNFEDFEAVYLFGIQIINFLKNI